MKISIAIVIILLAAGFGVPGWIGGTFENRVRTVIEEANDTGAVVLELKTYDRGWFQTSGILEARFSEAYVKTLIESLEAEADNPDSDEANADIIAALEDGRLRFELDAHHGPLGFTDDGAFFGASNSQLRLLPMNEEVERWQQEAGIPNLFEMRFDVGFPGDIDIVADAPSMEYEKDGMSVAFSGLDAEGRYMPGEDRFIMTLQIDRLQSNKDDRTVSIKAVDFMSDSTLWEDALWLGETTISVGSISMSTEGVAFDATGMQIVSNAKETDSKKMEMSVSYLVDSIDTNDAIISDFDWTTTVGNVDISAMRDYIEFMQRSFVDPDELSEQELTDLVEALVYSEPFLEFDPMTALYDGEPIVARLRMTVDAAALPPRDQFDSGALSSMSRQLILAEGAVEISGPLARQATREYLKSSIAAAVQQQELTMSDAEIDELAEQQTGQVLGNLIMQGFLVEEEAGYRSKLAFEAGQLSVNGNIIPLPEMPVPEEAPGNAAGGSDAS